MSISQQKENTLSFRIETDGKWEIGTKLSLLLNGIEESSLRWTSIRSILF